MIRKLLVTGALAIACISFAACGKSGTTAGGSGEGTKAAHNHEGWWCNEHGVPEEVCAQCNSKLVGDFKAKNDWCDEHNRPESQCFICHPEKEAEFAALYEAKYGKQPPKRDAEEGEGGAHTHEHPEKS